MDSGAAVMAGDAPVPVSPNSLVAVAGNRAGYGFDIKTEAPLALALTWVLDGVALASTAPLLAGVTTLAASPLPVTLPVPVVLCIGVGVLPAGVDVPSPLAVALGCA